MNNIYNYIFVRGDTIKWDFQLFINKKQNIPWDLTNYQIRFQLQSQPILKKATNTVIGGSEDQILIINPNKGKFRITITKEESTLLTPKDYEFEINITSPQGEKTTVLRDKVLLRSQLIEWENV